MSTTTVQLITSELVGIAAAMSKEIMLRKVNAEVVKRYAEAMLGGATFPPIVIGNFPHSEKYGSQAIVDGIHRIEAAVMAKIETLPVDVIDYKSLPDMLAHMYMANMEHGLPVAEGDRNKRIKLLRQQGMKLADIAKAFTLHTSSVDRIVKNEQGEGKSGPKGANKSAGQKSSEPKKPSAIHKMIQTLDKEFARKRPNTIVEYCAYLSPATEEETEGEVDTEKLADIENVIAWLKLVVKEVKG